MATMKVIFVIFVILQGFHCLSLGNVTAESRLIFQGFFNHSGFEDQEATREERITTDEDISAIRGMDVSGQNGEAYIMSYSVRSVQLLFSSNGVGRGFNFSLELYTSPKTDGDGGAASKSVSSVLIAISLIIGLTCFTRL